MIKKFLLSVLLTSLSLNAFAWGMSETISGSVTCGKKPLAGVVISDGFNCTVTDAQGHYTLQKNDRATNITVSTPSGYLPPVDEFNRPMFFIPVEEGRNDYSFTLKKNPKDDKQHVFLAQADIQVVNEDELCQFDEQVADAREHLRQYDDRDRFVLDAGDVVGDHPELYESSLRHRSGFGVPYYIANGNHDMQYYGRTHETSKKRFEQNIGPTNYSFNRGDVHYVTIDNCFYIGRDYFYMGYVDEQTFDWLRQDLSYVPEGSTVVMLMHIPVAWDAEVKPFSYNGKCVGEETVNGRDLIEMLKPYKTHFITGHQHWTRNVEYSDRCFEHNTPGACGMWWDIPLCSDGTPQGYGVYIVDGPDIKWYFKSKGRDKDYQMRVYAPGADDKYPDEIIANVWNYDPQWKVEWLEDGKVAGEMTQYEGKDPLTVELTADKSKLRYSWIGAANTSHLFRAKPNNPGAKLAVRVTDRFGNTFTATPKKSHSSDLSESSINH